MTTETRLHSTRGALLALTCLALLVLSAAPATAIWVKDGSVVIQRIWNRDQPMAVRDGAGGVLVVFQDLPCNASIGSRVYDIQHAACIFGTRRSCPSPRREGAGQER